MTSPEQFSCHVHQVDFRELISIEEWTGAFGVVSELREHLTVQQFRNNVEDLKSSGYRLFALLQGETAVTVAGVRVLPHMSRGKELWIHDLVTASQHRSKGLGAEMLRSRVRIT